MGRDGGGDVRVFATKEEAENYVAAKKKENADNIASYQGDSTDSGRGKACEDGGGFWSFKVVQNSLIFQNKEEATKTLEEVAEQNDPKNDSIVYVIGAFRVLPKDAATTKETETKAFVKDLHAVIKVPEGESFFNPSDSADFVQCSHCNSRLARPFLLKKRLHLRMDPWDAGNIGICPVCDSDTKTKPLHFGLSSESHVITYDEWQALTGGGYSRTGAELKRARTLFNDEHARECDELFIRGKEMKESFKKRKKNLDSMASETNFIVVSSWTSAHY